MGVISREDAIDFGLTGPNLRGSGVEYDLRKAHPYLVYDQIRVRGAGGHGRRLLRPLPVRMEEMRQSVRILHQCLDRLPGGRAGERRRTAKSCCRPRTSVLTSMEELIHHFINVTQGMNAPPGEIYFGARESQGRTGLLHPQQGRRHAAPAEDPLAFVCEPEHPAAAAARPHDQRHGGHPGLVRFCDGRVRPMKN